MYRRFALALLLAVTGCALAAVTASAAESISISYGSDPTEEVPVAISTTWNSASSSAEAFITVKPSGGQGCAPSYAADDPNSSDVVSGYGASGTASANRTFDDPGAFILCGYLQNNSSDTTPRATTGPVTVTVRSAHASIAITAPARVDPGTSFAISVPVTAELRREVFVTVKPAGGRACEATYALDDPNSSDVLSDSAQGTQTLSATWTAGSSNGTYLLCAYVQENSSDPSPEATGSTQFRVGPDPCVSAKQALRKARKATLLAEKAATHYRRQYTRYGKLARANRGATRRKYQRLATRAHSRYRSAVRRRAAARALLVRRQAGVASSCPAA